MFCFYQCTGHSFSSPEIDSLEVDLSVSEEVTEILTGEEGSEEEWEEEEEDEEDIYKVVKFNITQ